MTGQLDALDAIQLAVWQELGAACQATAHPWRTPVLATIDGASADARTVVLREVDAARRQLTFFTDARSPKVAQLSVSPEGTLLFWSPVLGWQLRCRVRLTVETTGLRVSSRWARVKLSSNAQDYLSAQAPGSLLHEPARAHDSRAHFAVLTADVLGIDWLELAPSGHRRAWLTDGDDSHWRQP